MNAIEKATKLATDKRSRKAVKRLRDRVRACKHRKCVPEFDEAAAMKLHSYEVRERWPRFDGECPDCGGRVICYVSVKHYILGDY